MNRNLKRENRVRFAAVLLILTVSTVVILKVANMLPTIVLALILTYLLTPGVVAIERTGLSRRTAVLAVFAIIGAAMALALIQVGPNIIRQSDLFQKEIPLYIQSVTIIGQDMGKLLAATFSLGDVADWNQHIQTLLAGAYSRFFQDLPGMVSASISTLILAPLFAFFMLLDGQKAIRQLLSLVPNPYFEQALNLQYQISRKIGGFIQARFLEATIVGIIIWLGLMMIGLPFSGFLAVFAALTNLIPYLGPIIGLIPALLVSYVGNGSAGIDLISLIGIYSLAQLIDAVLIVPLVVAKIVNLHAIIVIVVIIVGAELGGILGMVISIPVACILLLTAMAIYQHLLEYDPGA